MKITRGLVLLLASCGTPAAPPPQSPAPAAPAAALPSVSATVTGIDVDDQNPADSALTVRVSFANNTNKECVIWAYDLAWDSGSGPVRPACGPPGSSTSLDPNGTAEVTCQVPNPPMRDAMRDPGSWKVEELVAVCPDPATPAAEPSPVSATFLGMDLSATAMTLHVALENAGGVACEVASYSVAWTNSPFQPRHVCPSSGVRLTPSGTAETTCVVPDRAPMRRAMGAYNDRVVVMDIMATCPASK